MFSEKWDKKRGEHGAYGSPCGAFTGIACEKLVKLFGNSTHFIKFLSQNA
jgi:hypothetical protein